MKRRAEDRGGWKVEVYYRLKKVCHAYIYNKIVNLVHCTLSLFYNKMF